MKNENFKIQMIAIQALHEKYGFCPAPEQVKLLESDGEGTYILFRVGEHDYRCDDGEIINLEDREKSEEAISHYFNMFLKISEEKGIADDRIRALTKRVNELRIANHRMKDQIRKLEPAASALIKMISNDQEA